MSWLIALAGFCALIVLHEAGHFFAAKLVGMRVERFSLFFPPKLLSVRRGETEYSLGALPLGGYVKITGMSPDELRDTDLRLVERTYYMKAPWKRIFVIVAGPAVNLVIAFALFSAVLLSGNLDGAGTIGRLAPSVQTLRLQSAVGGVLTGGPAASGGLRVGDRLVSIDGRPAAVAAIERVVTADSCAGTPRSGCLGQRPLTLGVRRAGRLRDVTLTPRYDRTLRRMLIGIDFSLGARHFGVLGAIGTSAAVMWDATQSTVTHLVDAITSTKARRQVSSVIGIAQTTQQAVALGPGYGLVVLAFISLILGVMNLFPFLPLDGGHVLWSLAEKLRGRRVSVATMWRFSSVGIVLLAFLVFSGVSNDLSRLGA